MSKKIRIHRLLGSVLTHLQDPEENIPPLLLAVTKEGVLNSGPEVEAFLGSVLNLRGSGIETVLGWCVSARQRVDGVFAPECHLYLHTADGLYWRCSGLSTLLAWWALLLLVGWDTDPWEPLRVAVFPATLLVDNASPEGRCFAFLPSECKDWNAAFPPDLTDVSVIKAWQGS